MLATLGDLVDDVVVHVLDPTNVASDTRAHIVRRRGGSAANVASSAARTGARSRFLGQVGDDAIGAVLLAELSAAGVGVSHVVRVGTTGTIVVLVDPSGERTMLTDRRWCSSVGPPERSWLEGVDVLHVPLYSWQTAPLSDTATTLVRWAHESGIVVSVDLSSAAVLRDMGAVAVRTLLGRLAPEIVFANADEADELGGPSRFGAVATVIKDGGHPTLVLAGDDDELSIAPERLDGPLDTTGAGDAFAAGFLSYRGFLGDATAACGWAHRVAHQHVLRQTARTP